MILNGSKKYLRLSSNFIPKILEKPYLFDKKNDELYELSESALNFVLSFKDGVALSEIKNNKRFIKSLLRLKILEESDKKIKRNFNLKSPPTPTLRYLEIQLTSRCNLKCKHCYQGEKKDEELPIDKLKKILKEFIDLQGLRILLSGGEPLLYSHFKELNSFLKNYPAYTVLITNGTLLNKIPLTYITNIDEIQVSIDGMEKGHNILRGEGTFQKIISGITRIKQKTNKKLSFATMVHKKNINEFKSLSKLIKSFEAKEWGIDYPVFTGFFQDNKALYPSLSDAIKVMKHRFGASYHFTNEDNDYACGIHTMTLLPNGNFVACSFFPDKFFGTIDDGLEVALKNRSFFKLSDIKECLDCTYLRICKGGCRYRAGNIAKKDPLMCKIYKKE